MSAATSAPIAGTRTFQSLLRPATGTSAMFIVADDERVTAGAAPDVDVGPACGTATRPLPSHTAPLQRRIGPSERPIPWLAPVPATYRLLCPRPRPDWSGDRRLARQSPQRPRLPFPLSC